LKVRKGFLTGDALEALVAKHFREQGYTCIVAKAELVWLGQRNRCRRCRKFHPSCDSKPRSKSHDFFGCVDVLGFRRVIRNSDARDCMAIQCGPGSGAAKKRNDMDKYLWPLNTRTMVVTPDHRVNAVPGRYRCWERGPVSWKQDYLELGIPG
jgi:hypothetical protein